MLSKISERDGEEIVPHSNIEFELIYSFEKGMPKKPKSSPLVFSIGTFESHFFDLKCTQFLQVSTNTFIEIIFAEALQYSIDQKFFIHHD